MTSRSARRRTSTRPCPATSRPATTRSTSSGTGETVPARAARLDRPGCPRPVEDGRGLRIIADAAGPAGDPTLGVFTNDLSWTSGKARVQVTHTAVAPTVGVCAEVAVPVVPAFSNGQQDAAVVPAEDPRRLGDGSERLRHHPGRTSGTSPWPPTPRPWSTPSAPIVLHLHGGAAGHPRQPGLHDAVVGRSDDETPVGHPPGTSPTVGPGRRPGQRCAGPAPRRHPVGTRPSSPGVRRTPSIDWMSELTVEAAAVQDLAVEAPAAVPGEAALPNPEFLVFVVVPFLVAAALAFAYTPETRSSPCATGERAPRPRCHLLRRRHRSGGHDSPQHARGHRPQCIPFGHAGLKVELASLVLGFLAAREGALLMYGLDVPRWTRRLGRWRSSPAGCWPSRRPTGSRRRSSRSSWQRSPVGSSSTGPNGPPSPSGSWRPPPY